MSQTIDPLWYTVEEAAAAIKLSRSLTYRLVKEGRIPAQRFGRCWRVPKKQLEKMSERGGIDNGN